MAVTRFLLAFAVCLMTSLPAGAVPFPDLQGTGDAPNIEPSATFPELLNIWSERQSFAPMTGPAVPNDIPMRIAMIASLFALLASALPANRRRRTAQRDWAAWAISRKR